MQHCVMRNFPESDSEFSFLILDVHKNVPDYRILPRVEMERAFEIVNESTRRPLPYVLVNVFLYSLQVCVAFGVNIIKPECFMHGIINSIEHFICMDHLAHIPAISRVDSSVDHLRWRHDCVEVLSDVSVHAGRRAAVPTAAEQVVHRGALARAFVPEGRQGRTHAVVDVVGSLSY